MSSLHDRSDSPRVPPPRRRTTSRMHPGWKVFFLAWLSGLFSILAVGSWFARMMGHGTTSSTVITTGLAIGFFILGGLKAEKLTDSPNNGGAQ